MLLGAYYVDGEIVMVRRVCLLVLAGLAMAAPVASRSSTVIVSTTTSTQDSGLLDVLVPMFEKKSGMSVKTISVGTGQALALAARGEADVTLAHAPELERRNLAEGKMLNRRLVMYNDFVIIGPEDDPAKIKGITKAVDPVRAWDRPSASPMTAGPTRSPIGPPGSPSRNACLCPSSWRGTSRS